MHKIFTNTLFIGKKLKFLPSCHSTNTIASEMVMSGEATNGHIVITDFQEKGRGQRGNRWESEPSQNLLFSIILDAAFLDPSECFYLNIITSLALIDVLNEYTGDQMKVKWPNDIYYENKKVSGMLIENFIKKNSIGYSIIGIGLNVNQEKFANEIATSLALICHQKFDKQDLLEYILIRLEQRFLALKKSQLSDLKSEYFHNMYWKDEIHVFKDKDGLFNGRIVGVEDGGKILLELEEGYRLYDFKQIEFIK